MCLTATPNTTEVFRQSNTQSTITCWKVLIWRTSGRTKSGKRLESACNYTNVGWQPGRWYKADKIRSRLNTTFQLRANADFRFEINNGIHVCTSRTRAVELKSVYSYDTGVVVPVEVEMKDLIAAGNDGMAVFKRARILKKDFPKPKNA